MLRYITRALAACASIAVISLIAPTASAQFREHPVQARLAPNADDIGPNVEGPEEPAFGNAVAIRSELAFIGMPARTPSGRVGVFTATATQLIRTGTITPSDSPPPGRFSGFGRTLAYRDGILVVGSGQAAYIFTRNGSGVWTQRQKLTPPAADGVHSFADALRYEDGTLAVGANIGTAGPAGAVYIYQRDASGKFITRGKLFSPDSAQQDDFGASISTAGAAMVVGAPGIGRAYVFRRNSAGVWRWQQTLVASEGAGNFGAGVAIDRGMIIVGAPRRSEEGDDVMEPHGAAYGFLSNGSIYVETFKLQPQPEDFNDDNIFFGRQVAMFGDRIVVGAQRANSSEGQLNGTAVFSYTRSGSSVLPRGFALRDSANSALALADDRLLVGIACNKISAGFCPGETIFYRLNVFK